MSSPSSTAAENKVTDCIVVGSGLAGLTTALTCLDRGGKVLLLEKEPCLGGNSVKASSGINACPVLVDGTVAKEEIQLFIQDTIQSAGKGANSEVIEKLVSESASALKWLKYRVKVDLLQNRTRLGGHTRARTHRPAKGAVGYSVISGMQMALKPFQESGALEIMTETSLTGLIPSEDENTVTGVTAKQGSKEICLNAQHVVLATGGFAADRANDSYLAKYRPELIQMPATFGNFSTGDGIKLATAIGAGICLMDKVQVHPTGFIDPEDPSNPSKFLCAELLRGIGGILLNGRGQRFCNELGTRDYIADKMMLDKYPSTANKNVPSSQTPTFYLVLGSDAAMQGAEHVGFYIWKNLMQRRKGVNQLAIALDVPVEALIDALTSYQSASTEGKDPWGKTSFPNCFSADLQQEDFLVGKVTPVLHYCMGGITVTMDGNVLDRNYNPISGLHAVGEVAGGTHGDNRLAGNSLLECLVFGTIIGNKIPIQSAAGNADGTQYAAKISPRATQCP